ncbi:MAG: hypothetical protein ACOZBL_01790 [Patescibacteria group bacterium]
MLKFIQFGLGILNKLLDQDNQYCISHLIHSAPQSNFIRADFSAAVFTSGDC